LAAAAAPTRSPRRRRTRIWPVAQLPGCHRAGTATFPLRIIDFIRTPDNVLYNATTPMYVQFLVRFNTHAYLVPAGI
jgi:hypothetical protein